MPKEKPISLYPLKPEEALGAMLRTPPPPKAELFYGKCHRCGVIVDARGHDGKINTICSGCGKPMEMVSQEDMESLTKRKK